MILDARGNPFPIMANGYSGAVETRQRKKNAFNRSLPYDEDNLIGSHDLDTLRRECLDLRRNNAIVAGVVERFADHVVGPNGIHPQAKTDDPEWNDQAEQYWHEWAKIADHRRRVNLREIQRLVVQSRLMLGDAGIVLLANGQIQPIEAMRIRDPVDSTKKPEGVVNGVRLSRDGIQVAYYVHARDKNGIITGRDYEVVRAEDFVFISRPMRMDQVRGIPELAPILNAVTDFGRLQEEVLNKSVLDAMHAWAVYSEQGGSALSNLGPRGYSDELTGGATTAQKFETFEGGQTYYLRPGEKIESLASSTPNPQYVGYSELLMRIMASALSIPYEFLVLDFKGGSFSASRAALMTTYRTFAMWQTWLIETMMQRMWNWRIAKAIKNGDIPPAPVDSRGYSQWYRVHWSLPRYDWIDPKAEAAANEKNFIMGTETLTSLCHAKGRDAEDVLIEKGKDIANAERIAREINTAHGTSLTWHDLIGVGNASMVGAAQQPQPNNPEEDDNESE